MKIAIVGAGFLGLSAGYYLTKAGHKVEFFEREDRPGGLAIGYREPEWKWTLERYYHHWFTNDNSVFDLAKEIGYKVLTKRPKTSSYIDGHILQLDSPYTLLKFQGLTFVERLRVGLSLSLLRFNPFWKHLEKYRAVSYLKSTMGDNAYRKLWKPLMDNKLGKYSNKVSLAWFWARIYKRTSSLAYPEGGFMNFAVKIQNKIEVNGGKFHFNTGVIEINSNVESNIIFKNKGGNVQKDSFDAVLVTLPTNLFRKMVPELPMPYFKKLNTFKGIGATNLVLRLKKPFFTDKTYWLNMCDPKSPILVIVEHTNFMNKKYYNNEHILYIGNYLDPSDPRFNMTSDQLLKLYDPWLKKINPTYKSQIIGHQLSRVPFAQPIIFKNYSKKIPDLNTPLSGIYLANIQQVYPWDRGTNYAIELGKNAAVSIVKNKV